jgi:hypothetical protein
MRARETAVLLDMKIIRFRFCCWQIHPNGEPFFKIINERRAEVEKLYLSNRGTVVEKFVFRDTSTSAMKKTFKAETSAHSTANNPRIPTFSTRIRLLWWTEEQRLLLL